MRNVPIVEVISSISLKGVSMNIDTTTTAAVVAIYVKNVGTRCTMKAIGLEAINEED